MRALFAAHEDAAAFYRDQLLRSDGPRGYLTNRGMAVFTRPDLPWRSGIDLPWRLGYAPAGWTTLIDHLNAFGYTPDELHAAALATRTRRGRLVDSFRDRIVFPIRDHPGRIVAFIGRAAPHAPAGTPKYLNSRDTAIFHKGQTLYGYAEQHDRLEDRWAPVLVEGPLDVLAVWLAYTHDTRTGRAALAPCGTSLTSNQATTILGLPGARRYAVTVAFDSDPAGRTAAVRAFGLLSTTPNVRLLGAQLADGDDPAALATAPRRLHDLRAALTYRAVPLAQVVVEHQIAELQRRHPRALMEIEGQVAAVRLVAPTLARIPGDEARHLVERVAAIAGVGADIVVEAVLQVYQQQRSPADSPPPASMTEHDWSPPQPPGQRRRGAAFRVQPPSAAVKPSGHATSATFHNGHVSGPTGPAGGRAEPSGRTR